jgi:hypothetical protein
MTHPEAISVLCDALDDHRITLKQIVDRQMEGLSTLPADIVLMNFAFIETHIQIAKELIAGQETLRRAR